MKDKRFYHDTFFMDAETALIEAKKNNRVYIGNPEIDGSQICYYAGDEEIPNAPYNCINVPLENVYNYFVSTRNRFPSEVNFNNTEYNQEEKNEFSEYFNTVLELAIKERDRIASILITEINSTKPDFTEEKWRIFIPTCRETTVMQYVSKNIAEAFEKLGFEVHFFIQENDLQVCKDSLPLLFKLHQCKPHIYVSINNPNNVVINEDTFLFTWFQDPMPILYNEEKLLIRQRDYFFTLFDKYKNALTKKGISEKNIFHQSFATNPNLFYKDDTIQKEDKIVFLGSDYNFEKEMNFDITECINLINKAIDKNRLSKEFLQQLAIAYQIKLDSLEMYIIPSLVRRRVVIWLCSLKNIKVEVYGTDKWLHTPEVKPFYKGLLPYGKEMSKVYNSAKYALAVHPQYRYQQRVIEISACGTIPIVYNCDLVSEDFNHEDNVLSFSTKEDLINIIGKSTKKDPSQIAEDISYKKMCETIIDKVKQELKG